MGFFFTYECHLSLLLFAKGVADAFYEHSSDKMERKFAVIEVQ